MALVLHPTLASDVPRDESDPNKRSGSVASTDGDTKRAPYRGLSNQGATCYLNSLLQSLFMTPEFRTAIFSWRYDEEKDGPKEECIPYQLQSLFGQMQLSKAGALSTKALTESFGWGNAEAFQQQDVQELCRVLFDRLEEAFKDTPNHTLVNDLYQGKMVDYLETIGYPYVSNKTSEFLDISLQIKAFGSEEAFSSVDESLRSYLAPERLEKENQILVEEAKAKLTENEPESNARFDAIKGFRLEKLPYVLTLQLKRFDLNYTTFQRVKLNDQVRFPRILDMNEFVFKPVEEKSPQAPSKKAPTSEGGEGEGGGQAGVPCEESVSVVDDNDGADRSSCKGGVNNDRGGEGGNGAAATSDSSSSSSSSAAAEGGATALGSNGDTRGEFERAMFLERERLLNQTTTSSTGKASASASSSCDGDGIETKECLGLEGSAAASAIDLIPDLPDLVDVSGVKSPDQFHEEAEAAKAVRERKFKEDDDPDPTELVRLNGEWVYELYAVLIHSGSALGGHYYAYIKNMASQKWFNFNDSSVTEVESFEGTVRSAWGGSTNSASVGANAYMLLYRKFDPSSNQKEPVGEEVPKYIRDEVERAEAEVLRKESVRAERARELGMRLSLGDPLKAPKLGLVVQGSQAERSLPFDKLRTLRSLKLEAARLFGIVLEVDVLKKKKADDEKQAREEERQAAATAAGGEEAAEVTQQQQQSDGAKEDDEDSLDDLPDLDFEGSSSSSSSAAAAAGSEEALKTAAAVLNAHFGELGVPEECLRVREVHASRKVMTKPFSRADELETLQDLKFYSYKKVGLEVRLPGAEFPAVLEDSIFVNVVKYNPALPPSEPQAMLLPWRTQQIQLTLGENGDMAASSAVSAAPAAATALGAFEEAMPVFVSKLWTLKQAREAIAEQLGMTTTTTTTTSLAITTTDNDDSDAKVAEGGEKDGKGDEDAAVDGEGGHATTTTATGGIVLFRLATGVGVKTTFLLEDDKLIQHLYWYDSMTLWVEEMPALPSDANDASQCKSQLVRVNADNCLPLSVSPTLDDDDSSGHGEPMQPLVADLRWTVADLRRAIALSFGIPAKKIEPTFTSPAAEERENGDGTATVVVVNNLGHGTNDAAAAKEGEEEKREEQEKDRALAASLPPASPPSSPPSQPPSQPVYEFRLMLGLGGSKEVKNSATKTLKEECFYKGAKLYLKSGRSAEAGEYYFKVFLFQKPGGGKGATPGVRAADLPPAPPLPTPPLPPPLLVETSSKLSSEEDEAGAAEVVVVREGVGSDAVVGAVPTSVEKDFVGEESKKEEQGGGDPVNVALQQPTVEPDGDGASTDDDLPDLGDSDDDDLPGLDNSAAVPFPASAASPPASAAAAADGDGDDGNSDDEFDDMPELDDENAPPPSAPPLHAQGSGRSGSLFGHQVVVESPCHGDFDDSPMSVLVSEATLVREVRLSVFRQCVSRGLLSEHDDIARVRVREKEGFRGKKILRDTGPPSSLSPSSSSSSLPLSAPSSPALRTVKQAGLHVYDGRELACEILDDPEDLVEMEQENTGGGGGDDGDNRGVDGESGVEVEAAVRSNLTSTSGPGVVVWVCRWQKASFTVSTPFEFFARTNETLGQLNGRLARATGIDQPVNCRVFRVPLYGPLPKLHELKGKPLPRALTQVGWQDLTGQSVGEPLRAKKLMRDGALNLQELSSDLLVVQDVSEPLRDLTEAEKSSIELAKSSSSLGGGYGYPSSNMNVGRAIRTGTYPPVPSTYVKPKETGVLIKKRGGARENPEAGVVIANKATASDYAPSDDDDGPPPLLDAEDLGFSELNELD